MIGMVCNDLARVAGWKPYDISSTCFLGQICTAYADPAQHSISADLHRIQMIYL